MTAEPLSAALTREHHEIDAGLATYASSLGEASPRTEALKQAVEALRRHIYLEEEFVFPPLRAAGLMAPVLVMLREHGQIWRALETLEVLVADGAPPAPIRAVVEELVFQLDRHNTKEEPIVYPQADTSLAADAAARLRTFLAGGRTPDGWVCAHACR